VTSVHCSSTGSGLLRACRLQRNLKTWMVDVVVVTLAEERIHLGLSGNVCSQLGNLVPKHCTIPWKD
jgi:hypothetical protein